MALPTRRARAPAGPVWRWLARRVARRTLLLRQRVEQSRERRTTGTARQTEVSLRDRAEHIHGEQRVLTATADRYLMRVTIGWLTPPA